MSENSFGPGDDQKDEAVSGKGNQLNSIYDKYAPALLGLISRIAHSQDMAEEILKTTFLRIRDQIGSYDASRISLLSWLLNIARHTALDETRSVQLKIPGHSDLVYNQINNNNDHDHAFYLIYYKGLSCNEAASALNISVEELKINIRTAIKKLKSTNLV